MEYPVVMDTNRMIAGFLGALVFFGIVIIAYLGASLVVPFIFALLVTLVFTPFMDKLSRIRFPNGLAVLIVLLIFFFGCFIMGFFLFNSVNAVMGEIPKYYEKLENLSTQLFAFIDARFGINLGAQLADVDWFDTVRPYLIGFSGGFIGFVKNLGIVILFLIFLLIEAPYFQKTIIRAFPRKTGLKIMRVYKHTIRQISQYLGLKAIISFATGFTVWLFLTIIGLDFALLWGLLAVLFNFIPSIGSVFIMAGTILMGFLQFYPSWGRVLAVAISMVGSQLFWGNFLDPRLQGERLKLSPLIILLSLFTFGALWGIAGMFLSVPMLSVLKILCENIPGLTPIAVVLENGRGHDKLAKKKKKRLNGDQEVPTKNTATVPVTVDESSAGDVK